MHIDTILSDDIALVVQEVYQPHLIICNSTQTHISILGQIWCVQQFLLETQLGQGLLD